jgi:transposase-like protein
MKVIRYSPSFKLQLVSEVEGGELCALEVQRKYRIKGNGTVMRWVRQLGSGKYGKVIRVEKADEFNEARQLRTEVRKLKGILADAHVELALEKAYLALACEQMNQTLESFKKKHAGARRIWR